MYSLFRTCKQVSVLTLDTAPLLLDYGCGCFYLDQSESLHREAYNAVFREFSVDYKWSPEYYDELQNKVRPKVDYL